MALGYFLIENSDLGRTKCLIKAVIFSPPRYFQYSLGTPRNFLSRFWHSNKKDWPPLVFINYFNHDSDCDAYNLVVYNMSEILIIQYHRQTLYYIMIKVKLPWTKQIGTGFSHSLSPLMQFGQRVSSMLPQLENIWQKFDSGKKLNQVQLAFCWHISRHWNSSLEGRMLTS